MTVALKRKESVKQLVESNMMDTEYKQEEDKTQQVQD